MDIEKPAIVHKYITLFSTEDAYNEAYSNFTEANWSDVGYPEDTPDNYRLSRRLSNMYHKDNPPDYKFNDINDKVVEQKEEFVKDDDGNWQIVYRDVDIYPDAHRSANYRLLDYSDNCIRKAFFLEVVWGYSGWEWVDYRRTLEDETQEILTGGNLYEMKNIVTVPHIIDGYRLQHINDFLFNQYNVTRIEGFDTSNIIAANKAFKRGIDGDTSYPKRYISDIKECHFVIGSDENGNFYYPFGYTDPVTGESFLSNLVEADKLFYNNKIYMHEGNLVNSIPFTIPNIKSIDSFYAYGVYTDNLQFKMESLEELTNAFKCAIFPQSVINVNDIFVGTTLNKIKNFSSMFGGATIRGFQTINDEDVASLQLDLSSSEVNYDDVINLSHFAEWLGNGDSRDIVNRRIVFSFKFANAVDLSYLFANAMRDKQESYDVLSILGNSGFNKVTINFNNTDNFIRSLDNAFINNIFLENLPILARPNVNCTDNSIYEGSTFNSAITYDFSPNQVVYDSSAQFKNVKVYDNYAFNHIDCLKNINFERFMIYNNGELTTDSIFNYVLNNAGYTYIDNTRYQTVTFKDSNIASFPVQSFYVDIQNGTTDIFAGMRNIDFTSDHKLYLKDFTQTVSSKSLVIPNFSGCVSMTQTPEIYYNFDGSGVSVMSNIQFFKNCDNLVTLNCTNVNIIRTRGGDGTNESTVVFSSLVLRYFNIGNWDLPIEIRSAVLDIPTFKASMLRQNATNKHLKKLWIHTDVYDTLKADTSFWDSLNAVYSTIGRYIPNN